MHLHEYQSKFLFNKYGIPLTNGILATAPQEVYDIARELGGSVVVKAQVTTTGRGRAGGIKLARSAEQARTHAESIFGMIIGGQRVHKLLVDPLADIAQEFYLGIKFDRGQTAPVLTAIAGAGGKLAPSHARNTGKIINEVIDPLIGLRDFQIRQILTTLDIAREYWKPFSEIAHRLYKCFQENDAVLAELNPLALTPGGQFVCVDGRLILDDAGLFRHPDLADMRDLQAETTQTMRARELGLSYVQLSGEIGCLVNGAGLALTLLDLTHDAAAQAGYPQATLANFVDLGGGARAEQVLAAMGLMLRDPSVRTVLISIFGGITRCDEIARGILSAVEQIHVRLPLVVRLAGTRAAEGHALIDEANLTNVQSARTLREAAEKAVSSVILTSHFGDLGE